MVHWRGQNWENITILRFLELFAEKREAEELPPLIQIATCGLHTIHGSMKAGVKNSNWNIGKILKAAWKLLDGSSCSKGATWESKKNLHISPTLLWPSLVRSGGLYLPCGAGMAGIKEICSLLERSTKMKAATKFIISNTSSGSWGIIHTSQMKGCWICCRKIE